jgi:MscS family membrane protein
MAAAMASRSETPEATAPLPLASEEAVPEALASARATVRTFLEAFDPALRDSGTVDLAAAAACLDLSAIPQSLRASKGEDLVVQLKDILDRTQYIVFEAIDDAPDGAPWVFLKRAEGEVTVAADETGRWLFTAATVQSIPALWKATADQSLVSGVRAASRTWRLWLRGHIPLSWQQESFFLERWQWLGLMILLLLGALLSRLVRSFFRRLLNRFLEEGTETLQPELFSRATLPLGIVVQSLAWALGLRLLDLPLGLLQILRQGVWFLGIAACVVLTYRLVDVLAAVLGARARRSTGRFDDLLVPLIRKLLKVVATIFGLIFIADNLNVEIGSLLAGLGLGGLAIALAAQDTVKNFFGSLTVLLDQPFEIGDAIQVGNVEGSVEEVGIRSTRIRTFENSLVTLPNAELISASVNNKGARVYRRWKALLSLTYDTSPERIEAFCEGVRELIRRHPTTRKDGYYVYLHDFGASSLDVLLYFFFETKDYQKELQARHEISLAILRLAEGLGVEFAFPTRTVILSQEGAAAPGQGEEGDLLERARRLAGELSPAAGSSSAATKIPASGTPASGTRSPAS